MTRLEQPPEQPPAWRLEAERYGWSFQNADLDAAHGCVVCAAWAPDRPPGHWHPCLFPRDTYRRPSRQRGLL